MPHLTLTIVENSNSARGHHYQWLLGMRTDCFLFTGKMSDLDDDFMGEEEDYGLVSIVPLKFPVQLVRISLPNSTIKAGPIQMRVFVISLVNWNLQCLLLSSSQFLVGGSG